MKNELNVDHSNTVQHLKQIDKVKKLDKQASGDLNDSTIEHPKVTCVVQQNTTAPTVLTELLANQIPYL